MQELGFEIYNHFPKPQPIDENTTIQFKISKEKYAKQKYAFIDAYEYEPKEFPYHPIRKIDSIEYIKQPTDALCGQSVIAMLAGISVNEVIEYMKNDGGTGVLAISNALIHYGYRTTTKSRIRYREGKSLPDCCVLGVKLPTYGHWSLYYKGKFYDPEFGVLDKLPENAKLVCYWEIII